MLVATFIHFANSNKNQRMNKKMLPIAYQNLLPGCWTKVPNYMIGGPVYPLTSYLMKEYTHCIHNEEVIFDNVIRSSKNQIKYAFGRLKASWSILTNQIYLELENTPYIIYSCFILHNFCKLSNIQIVEELVQAHIKETHTDDKNLSIPPRQYFCM